MQHTNPTAALPEVQTTKQASHTRSSRLGLRKIKKKEGKELSYTSESTGGAERQSCHTPKSCHTALLGFTSPLKGDPSPSLSKGTLSKPVGRGCLILKHMKVMMQEAPELGPAASWNRDFSPCCQSTKSNRQSCPIQMNLMSTLK